MSVGKAVCCYDIFHFLLSLTKTLITPLVVSSDLFQASCSLDKIFHRDTGTLFSMYGMSVEVLKFFVKELGIL